MRSNAPLSSKPQELTLFKAIVTDANFGEWASKKIQMLRVMEMTSITIPVTERAARAFQAASPAVQRHIQDLLECALLEGEELDNDAFQKATESLEQTVDEMAANARRRGLTDDILQAILNGPKA